MQSSLVVVKDAMSFEKPRKHTTVQRHEQSPVLKQAYCGRDRNGGMMGLSAAKSGIVWRQDRGCIGEGRRQSRILLRSIPATCSGGQQDDARRTLSRCSRRREQDRVVAEAMAVPRLQQTQAPRKRAVIGKVACHQN